MTDVAAAVDQERLWQRHMAMAEIGKFGETGVDRPALSQGDREARTLITSLALARGYTVHVDAIANLFIRREGSEPALPVLMSGSHMDSQPRGGRFDGIFGVLAGLETLEAMDDAGIATRHSIEVVAWTNEEGGRFQPGVMGSEVFVGNKTVADYENVRDSEGMRLGDELARTLEALPEAHLRAEAPEIAAYIEAHIEQGPVLEAAGEQVGIVTGIQGMQWYEVMVDGETAHAGTTPLAGRKDALRAAVALIQELQAITADPDDIVRMTVGKLLVEPNSPNSVPERVIFMIDLRHPSADYLAEKKAAIHDWASRRQGGCAIKVRQLFDNAPCVFDETIVGRLEASARQLGIGHRRMPSGASHDAHHLARICPTGMLFVPCAGGISHNEAEAATPEDLAAGTRVLAATLAAMAQ
ncbi:MAG: M20 family metallo-hydrolase [Pseudomonadota bacterium]